MKDMINGQPEQDIEHCGNCIHSADSLDVCVLWKCKYAIAELLDCYEPKQPEQRWIPCSERVPEDNRQVLIYAMSVHYALAKYDEMREADGTYKKQWVTFDAWKPFYTIKEVIAWMPLPEPYSERRQE